MFAFPDEDVLYLKTAEPGRAPFEAEGMGPFTYESKDGPIQTFSYYRAPERLLDDPDDLCEWVHRALAVSKRDAAAKAKRKGKAAAASAKPDRLATLKRKPKGKGKPTGTRKPAATRSKS
jgi:DNA transformation protein